MTRNPSPRDGSDEEGAFVAPFLTFMTDDLAQRDYALREVVNGLRWIVRTGGETLHRNVSPTRMLPTDLPPCSTVSQHTQRWLKAGVVETIVHDRRALVRDIEERAPVPRAAIVAARTMPSPPECGARSGNNGQ